MPRDYAKRSGRHSSQESSGFGSILLWFFIGVLVGLALAGFIYISKNNSHQTKRPEIVLPANPKNNPPAPATNSNSKAQFDFYNMLPSKQVTGPTGQEEATQAAATSPAAPTPTPATTPPPPPANVNPNAMLSQPPVIAATPAPAVVTPTVAKTKSATTSTATSSHYELQIGAFTNFAQADNLKAQLILSGFNAHSDTLKKGSSTLHRIWLGPYKTKDEAKKVQSKLKAAAIKSTLITK
jgi:cell division protein FtsN